MSSIEIYLLGALVNSSIMMWWFNTNLPIHIVQIIKLLGFKKSDKAFWRSETPMEYWTKVDYSQWKQQSLPMWLDELTECTGCFSFHAAFWTALGIYTITRQDAETLVSFLLAVGGWPYISNMALAILKKLQEH